MKFYRIRQVKNGPLCGLKVWYGKPLDPVTGEELDRGERWQVVVNSEFVDPAKFIIEFDAAGQPIINGEPCDEREYHHLARLHKWAVDHDPMAPEAAPRSPIDLNKLAPIKFA